MAKGGAVGYRERFAILEEIGEGGFARVYLARETASNRKVALKVLKDAYLKDPEIVERFRREVFAVASINSPHVVGMHDFGISGDEVYIAMEFVEGPTLRDLIYERSWTAQEIHVIVGQIAQALAAAHRQDIVHRDLKPENVMMVPGKGGSRTVKVLDFGLAKLAELERKLELEPLTRAGMCFGTPQYMAPELIQGKPFDRSVDLYALGVITFEMVAGFLPWDGSDPRQVLMAVVRNPPPHVTNPHATISRLQEVDAFLQRVLSKDKSKRPTGAEVFFRDLEHALFGDKTPPRRAEKVPKEDAAFASVWAASLELKQSDDATEVDAGKRFGTPVETTLPGGPSRSGVRRAKLRSAWLHSISGVETFDRTLEDTSTLESAPTPLASPRAPAPLPSDLYGPKTEGTEILKNPAPESNIMLWLVPLLIGLVIFAAALGYFLGRQSH